MDGKKDDPELPDSVCSCEIGTCTDRIGRDEGKTINMDDPDTLTSMGNLASTYRQQGQLDEAANLYEEVLESTVAVPFSDTQRPDIDSRPQARSRSSFYLSSWIS